MFEERETQLVLKLIKDTAAGKIIWMKSSKKIKESKKTSSVYETKIKDNVFLIYQYVYEQYIPDFDKFENTEDVKLEIYNASDFSLKYEFPSIRVLYDLFRVVNRKAEKIDDLFDEIIGKENVNPEEDII